MRTLNLSTRAIPTPASRNGKTILMLAVISLAMAAFCCLGLLAPMGSALADDPPGGQDPPEITNFVGENVYNNYWNFTGKVINCSPVEGLTVTFDGLAAGYTRTTFVDGTFLLTIEFPWGSNGWVTAQVTAADGQKSNIVMWLVQE